jgi:hypothetical protein
MQRFVVTAVAAAAVLAMLAGPASGSTFTLGSAAVPSGSPGHQVCSQFALVGQTGADPSKLAAMPAGGQITQWQTNTSMDAAAAAGEPVSLVALAPVTGTAYRIDAVDNETLPNPLPAGGVATFTPASPMRTSEGDILAISGGADHVCFWSGGSTVADSVAAFIATALNPGDIFTVFAATPGGAANAAATVVSTEDSAVTTTALPSSGPAGSTVVLASTVTDNGPAGGNPLTFADAVPAGFHILAALSTGGPCTTLGQVVTCTLSGLNAGQSSPVYIIGSAPAGAYTNSVTLTQPAAATDPVPANNVAAMPFTLVGPAAPKCTVVNLANLSLATAKKLLTALNCKVGKVTKSSSSKVAKGNVIKTTPRSGSFAGGTAIAIVESSGPKPKHKHKKKKK